MSQPKPSPAAPTRLLLVDDQPTALERLRDILVGADQWEVHCRGTGDAALAAIADGRFDVVATDLEMPGMGGVELLAEVRRISPETVRLIFSARERRQSSLRAVGPAHRWLAKPFEPDRIVSAIRRAIALRRMLRSDRVKATVSRIEQLPPIPRMYQRIMNELDSPTSTTAGVARVISSDPAMAAEVLRLSNSAFFGPSAEVSSIDRAVQLLGLDMVAILVLRAGLFRSFAGAFLSAELLAGIGEQSLRATRAARAIARLEQVDRPVADDATTGALLHEVGILILASAIPEYGAVLARQSSQGGPLGPHERDLLGVTHGEVGAYLLGLWNLPDGVVEAVANHESPEAVTDRDQIDAVTIVAAASALAHLYGPSPFEPDPEARSQVGFQARWPEWEEACRAELLLGAAP